MPDNNAKNVATGRPKAAGAVFVAPEGTALPTDATTPLDAAYTNLGLVSDAGVKNNQETSSTDFKEWGGQTVLTVITESKDTFTFELIEAMSADVLRQVFGAANVTEADGEISVSAKGGDRAIQTWVFEVLLTNGGVKRIVVPLGKVVSVGEVTYAPGELIRYPVTLATAPSADGETHFERLLAPAAG